MKGWVRNLVVVTCLSLAGGAEAQTYNAPWNCPLVLHCSVRRNSAGASVYVGSVAFVWSDALNGYWSRDESILGVCQLVSTGDTSFNLCRQTGDYYADSTLITTAGTVSSAWDVSPGWHGQSFNIGSGTTAQTFYVESVDYGYEWDRWRISAAFSTGFVTMMTLDFMTIGLAMLWREVMSAAKNMF